MTRWFIKIPTITFVCKCSACLRWWCPSSPRPFFWIFPVAPRVFALIKLNCPRQRHQRASSSRYTVRRRLLHASNPSEELERKAYLLVSRELSPSAHHSGFKQKFNIVWHSRRRPCTNQQQWNKNEKLLVEIYIFARFIATRGVLPPTLIYWGTVLST